MKIVKLQIEVVDYKRIDIKERRYFKKIESSHYFFLIGVNCRQIIFDENKYNIN